MNENGLFDLSEFDNSWFYIESLAPTRIVIYNSDLNIDAASLKNLIIDLLSVDDLMMNESSQENIVVSTQDKIVPVSIKKNVSIMFSQ